MPTNAERWAVDTSVAVAALDAGHAAFEVFSVLTRMPGQITVDAPTAASLISRVFPELAWLDADAAKSLSQRCGTLGIVGGAVYDALVGEAARHHRRTLLTRDLRAKRTYELLGVDYHVVEP
jgi:predicted nucleic acid-binding protein